MARTRRAAAAAAQPETPPEQPPPADDVSDNEESPQPVSSESEDSNVEPTTTSSLSRLFCPYRSLGIVAGGCGFHLVAHQNSLSSMLAVAIGDRFQLLQTDRLHPVLVSQTAPGAITHCVTDATLSLTVIGHDRSSVSLYRRTRRLATRSLRNATMPRRQWNTAALLHLGRIAVEGTGEKAGRSENVAVIGVVLARRAEMEDDDEEDVAVVGDEHDDDSDDDDSSDEEQADESDCQGQVVILLASRTSLQMLRRIRFTSLPTFTPRTAVHPSTYVNKIVVGGEDQGQPALLLVNIRSTKIVHVFRCLPTDQPACVTALEQSPAVDTLAIGDNQGRVHLINLRLDKELFSLQHKSLSGDTVTITSISFRTDASAMRCGIAPMAVGRSDGTVTVWDLTAPEDPSAGRTILCELDRIHPGGIAKLQYMPQEPLLVSTGTKSNSILMHIFDNPNHSGRILRQRKGHTAPPTRIRYLKPGAAAGGGVLVSDGTDASACQIVSSGGDDRTLRVFSTARTVLDKEYSQGKGLEKRAKELGMTSTAELLLPPVTALALADSRSRDWGDLVTIHQDHAFAYVWSTKRGAQSGPVLRQTTWNVSAMKVPPPPTTHAVSVAVSACGNFALVGTKGGVIYKYNVQSGQQRGSYPRDLDEAQPEERRKKQVAGDIQRTTRALEKKMKMSHQASNMDKKDLNAEQEARLERRRQEKLRLASHTCFAVTGIAVDAINKTLVSVGADKKLVLWNFATHAPHKNSPFMLPSAATKMCHVRESDLAAIALEDFTAVLFDCSSLSIVRRFGQQRGVPCHTGPITDLGFSPDGRTLFTSSMDSTIRVFDVPTSSCVDWLRFQTPPTSLTVSPTGEFLATTHTGRIGISVWSDRSYYQTVHVDGSPLVEPANMDEPVPLAETDGENRDFGSAPATTAAGETESEVQKSDEPVVPKEHGLVTLSNLPPAHWKNLFHLELVKERNKPKEPPKKPPSAPFFLQWRSGEALAEEPEVGVSESKKGEVDEWAAAWSDDEGDEPLESPAKSEASPEKRKRSASDTVVAPKRPKVTHHRSQLAKLLQQCDEATGEDKFGLVTQYIATLGPSAIDVALSSLCSGTHDLEEGLPLIRMACMWLVEACRSRERYEAVNAYLHRFLYLHATLFAELDKKDEPDDEDTSTVDRQQQVELLEAIAQLKQAQQSAVASLNDKMHYTLCLLRHFSRMV